MDSFKDIIGLWPNAEELAADLGEQGVTVRSWRNRNSIPAGHWNGTVAAAKKRSYPLTLEHLARAAETRERTKPA